MEDKVAPRATETFDIARLYELLPHRYPFLLVDRIINVDGDNSAVGIKAVTANEPHFQGHFPNRPVMPGVLLVEGIAQTAGAICSATLAAGSDKPRMVYFMSIEQAEIPPPRFPGHYRRVSRAEAPPPRRRLEIRRRSPCRGAESRRSRGHGDGGRRVA